MTIVKEKNELKSMQDLNRLRLLSSVKFGQFGRVIMEPGDKAHGCQARADLSLLIFLAPPLSAGHHSSKEATKQSYPKNEHQTKQQS